MSFWRRTKKTEKVHTWTKWVGYDDEQQVRVCTSCGLQERAAFRRNAFNFEPEPACTDGVAATLGVPALPRQQTVEEMEQLLKDSIDVHNMLWHEEEQAKRRASAAAAHSD